MTPLRLVFMGTPSFVVPPLEALIASPHNVVAVYTQPPRPSGRGQKITPSPVQQCAERHGIPIYHPKSLKPAEQQAAFAAHNLDAAIVAGYGLILPQAILDAPRHGCFNIHVSLLPRWRGAAPVQHAILAGDAETGTTIMQLAAGMDTGPMLAQQVIPITGASVAGALYDELFILGAAMIVPTLEGFIAGTVLPVRQDEAAATYADKLSREDGRLDWTRPAAELDRRIRALAPWPGTWFELNGEIVKVIAAVPVAGKGAPGTILDAAPTIACGDGALRLTRVQRPNRAAMDGSAFLASTGLGAGQTLT